MATVEVDNAIVSSPPQLNEEVTAITVQQKHEEELAVVVSEVVDDKSTSSIVEPVTFKECVKVASAFKPSTSRMVSYDYIVAMDFRATQEDYQELNYIVICTTELLCVHKAQFQLESTLNDALITLDRFIKDHFLLKNKTFCIATHTGWSLRHFLPKSAATNQLDLPEYFTQYFDLANQVHAWLTLNQLDGNLYVGKSSLSGLCADVDVERPDKASHSPKDQLQAVAEIIIKLIQKLNRWAARSVPEDVANAMTPFLTPIDTIKELEEFHELESCVVKLSAIPVRLLSSDIIKFLSREKELVVEEMWMLKTSEGKLDGFGYFKFKTHAEATEALSLSGRPIYDRALLVTPSSDRDFVADKLNFVPFPQNLEKPEKWVHEDTGGYRAREFRRDNTQFHRSVPPPPSAQSYHQDNRRTELADWICPNPSCNFGNFPTRFDCMRCQTPKPDEPVVISTSGAPSAEQRRATARAAPKRMDTDREGDWICSNSICLYHNYASREQCYRCQTVKPESARASGDSLAQQPKRRYTGGGGRYASSASSAPSQYYSSSNPAAAQPPQQLPDYSAYYAAAAAQQPNYYAQQQVAAQQAAYYAQYTAAAAQQQAGTIPPAAYAAYPTQGGYMYPPAATAPPQVRPPSTSYQSAPVSYSAHPRPAGHK